MIGRLSGILIEKQAPMLLVDVGGVGYEVQAPMSTFFALPELDQPVVLHTQFIVRQDAQLLYGFHSKMERALFNSLIKVNGVGPKLAITILSGIEPPQFAQCIADQDTTTLVRLPGVGKRTAERLVVEMRDKLEDWLSDELASNELGAVKALKSDNAALKDATNALISLGYKPAEVKKLLAKLVTDDLSSEQIIRAALQGAQRCHETA